MSLEGGGLKCLESGFEGGSVCNWQSTACTRVPEDCMPRGNQTRSARPCYHSLWIGTILNTCPYWDALGRLRWPLQEFIYRPMSGLKTLAFALEGYRPVYMAQYSLLSWKAWNISDWRYITVVKNTAPIRQHCVCFQNVYLIHYESKWIFYSVGISHDIRLGPIYPDKSVTVKTNLLLTH